MFWIPLFSAILNAMFIMDFVSIAFTGDSVATLLFGNPGSASIIESMTSRFPGMTPAEFFAVNAIILAFVCILMTVSIYIAFYSEKKECFENTTETPYRLPTDHIVTSRIGVRR